MCPSRMFHWTLLNEKLGNADWLFEAKQRSSEYYHIEIIQNYKICFLLFFFFYSSAKSVVAYGKLIFKDWLFEAKKEKQGMLWNSNILKQI